MQPNAIPCCVIREPTDIFLIQKCGVTCRASREWSKIKQANHVCILVFSGSLWEKAPSFPPSVWWEGQQPTLKSSYPICPLWAVCRLSRKQIKIQMCRLQNEQENISSDYCILCYKYEFAAGNVSWCLHGLASETLFQGTVLIPVIIKSCWMGTRLFPRFLELAGYWGHPSAELLAAEGQSGHANTVPDFSLSFLMCYTLGMSSSFYRWKKLPRSPENRRQKKINCVMIKSFLLLTLA